MGTRLYIGNLAYSLTEDELKQLFGKAGTVVSVNLISDRETGRPKGFGFVEMASEEEAKKAIEQLNGQTLSERQIVVNEARPQEKREGGGGGYRGGSGGFREQRRNSY